MNSRPGLCASTALLAGATGLDGRALLARLLTQGRQQRVTVVARKPLPATFPLDARMTVRAGDMVAQAAALPASADIYSALGTTIKAAGSEAAFRAVDLDRGMRGWHGADLPVDDPRDVDTSPLHPRRSTAHPALGSFDTRMIANNLPWGRFEGDPMRTLALALALVVAGAATLPGIAEARRIGGGGAVGMQRSLPSTAPSALPARPAAPVAQPAVPATAGAAAAAVPKRSWLGPIAGLAAGLGLAALMSHLGLGAEFGNIIMMALLAVAAFMLVRFLMRRFMPPNPAAASGGMQLAGAGAPLPQAPLSFPDERPAQFRSMPAGADAAREQPSGTGPSDRPVATVAATSLPAGFDAPAFERIAKMIFIRMQAANDTGDLNDLRAFTTPEMFATVKLDLQDRAGAAQQTDVVRVDAAVLDVASEADRQVVSVRFHGLIREETGGVAEPFDEVWHLVKPADGSREWAIAGIQQTKPALARAA